MRIAIKTVKTAKHLVAHLAVLPDPTAFPVAITFEGKQIVSIAVTGAKNIDEVCPSSFHEAASILDNLATLIDEKVFNPKTCTPDEFATFIEARHGRQVVEASNGKLITIGKVKEKAEGLKNFRPIVAGKPISDSELLVDGVNEKEASKKMQIRFVTAAASDKKLSLLIGAWLADGCKVEAVDSIDIPKDFIDLHSFK